MLGVKNYETKYIDSCRNIINNQLASYRNLIKSVPKVADTVITDFETQFLNNLVVVLDTFFVHRIRAIEGKDGNPLNEVRMLCNSLLNNGGRLTTDKTIKYTVASSVLKIKIGEDIKFGIIEFETLTEIFFKHIEKKYS